MNTCLNTTPAFTGHAFPQNLLFVLCNRGTLLIMMKP